jgi:S1-C subfamily serine protease
LQERQKSLSNRLHDTGSTHDLSIAGKAATIIIDKKGGVGGGFMYQLVIAGNPIEQNLCGPDMKGPLDIGTRPIALPKRPEGLGMTLRNNPLGSTGVVVWTVEPGKAAEQCGIQVGDVVLSIEDNLINNIDNCAEYVGACVGTVNMELAGTSNSRTIALQKIPPGRGDDEKPVPIGLGLASTSCGVGVLVTEIDKGSAAEASDLVLGDAVISIDNAVPKSPRHAVELIIAGGPVVNFVVIGNLTEVY